MLAKKSQCWYMNCSDIRSFLPSKHDLARLAENWQAVASDPVHARYPEVNIGYMPFAYPVGVGPTLEAFTSLLH